jgi:hypothetical protein
MLNASTDCSSLARLSPSRVFIHKRGTLHVKAAHHCTMDHLSLSLSLGRVPKVDLVNIKESRACDPLQIRSINVLLDESK